MDCEMYKKHHNIIDGIYLDRNPQSWEEIPFMDSIDAEDESGELSDMFKDIKTYYIEDLPNFINTSDEHNIKETIFIIIRDGSYYLCETQGENYIKFAINVSNISLILNQDRLNKINKIQNKSNID